MARRCKICLADDDDAAAAVGDMTFDFSWLFACSSIAGPLNIFIDNKEGSLSGTTTPH